MNSQRHGNQADDDILMPVFHEGPSEPEEKPALAINSIIKLRWSDERHSVVINEICNLRDKMVARHLIAYANQGDYKEVSEDLDYQSAYDAENQLEQLFDSLGINRLLDIHQSVVLLALERDAGLTELENEFLKRCHATISNIHLRSKFITLQGANFIDQYNQNINIIPFIIELMSLERRSQIREDNHSSLTTFYQSYGRFIEVLRNLLELRANIADAIVQQVYKTYKNLRSYFHSKIPEALETHAVDAPLQAILPSTHGILTEYIGEMQIKAVYPGRFFKTPNLIYDSDPDPDPDSDPDVDPDPGWLIAYCRESR